MEGLKIILVDDNIPYRESIKDLLTSMYNYTIIAEANNGEEFLELAGSLSPDLILMDLSMPNLNGYEATKKYFQRFPYSKVIAVTGHVEKAYLLKLIETGFKGCIFKFNFFEEIKKAIETVMNGKFWYPDEYTMDGDIELEIRN